MLQGFSAIIPYSLGMYITDDIPRITKIKATVLSILLTGFILWSVTGGRNTGGLFQFISYINLPIAVLVGFGFMAIFQFYFEYDEKLINNKIDCDIHYLIGNVVLVGFFTIIFGILGVGIESMIFAYICVFLFSHFIIVYLMMFQYVAVFAGDKNI